jgi:hypothetical protein
MKFAAILRKVGSDFRADKYSGEMRYFQRSLDGVMIRYRHIVHPYLLGRLIDKFGRCKTFGTVNFFKRPNSGLIGILRVDVNI